jgi:hypothetical protein
MVGIRKIAAILVSDVVGYSQLAGTDEDRILARLRTLRSDLIATATSGKIPDQRRSEVRRASGDCDAHSLKVDVVEH